MARRTSLSITADELAGRGQLLAAGQVVLQPKQRPLVIARLKAAMTRLGVAVPTGL